MKGLTILIYGIVIVLFHIVNLDVGANAQHAPKKALKKPGRTTAKRNNIIKCCGTKRCTDGAKRNKTAQSLVEQQLNRAADLGTSADLVGKENVIQLSQNDTMQREESSSSKLLNNEVKLMQAQQSYRNVTSGTARPLEKRIISKGKGKNKANSISAGSVRGSAESSSNINRASTSSGIFDVTNQGELKYAGKYGSQPGSLSTSFGKKGSSDVDKMSNITPQNSPAQLTRVNDQTGATPNIKSAIKINDSANAKANGPVADSIRSVNNNESISNTTGINETNTAGINGQNTTGKNAANTAGVDGSNKIGYGGEKVGGIGGNNSSPNSYFGKENPKESNILNSNTSEKIASIGNNINTPNVNPGSSLIGPTSSSNPSNLFGSEIQQNKDSASNQTIVENLGAGSENKIANDAGQQLNAANPTPDETNKNNSASSSANSMDPSIAPSDSNANPAGATGVDGSAPDDPIAADSDATSSNSSVTSDSSSSSNDTTGEDENEAETTEMTTTEEAMTMPPDEPEVDPTYDDDDLNGVVKGRDKIICEQYVAADEYLQKSAESQKTKDAENKSKGQNTAEATTAEMSTTEEVLVPTTSKPIYGTVIPACGREYFIGKDKASVYQGSANCLLKNMALLSIESLAEKSCLETLVPKLLFLGSKFWTSISNEGPDKSKYLQCASNLNKNFLPEFMDESHWARPAAKFPSLQRCLAFKINRTEKDNTTGFMHQSCHTGLSYICEPTCQKSSCPNVCSSNVTLFEKSGLLKNFESYGYWVESCGKKYLFGNKLMDWKENWNLCCSLGMEPVVIESAEEQRCLSNLTSAKYGWKNNFNYWTGGTQSGCMGQWKWCGAADPIVNTNIKWGPKEPDNKGGNEACMHMRIYTSGSDKGLRVTDRNCTDKYVYACQGSPMIGKLCNDDKATCPTTKCARKSVLFTSDKVLIGYKNYGLWLSGCNRNFLFSQQSLTWKDAHDKCCSIGMNLASLESLSKHRCFFKVSQQNIKSIGNYWTSGTDKDCPGKYHWCSANYPFKPKEIYWEAGHPKKTPDNCIYLKVGKTINNTVYGTESCNIAKRFICEVRQQGSAPDGLVDECAELEEPTLEDVERLGSDVFNASIFDRNAKFFGNGLLEVQTLRLLELNTQNNPQEMQQGFGAFSGCKDKKHEDECMTASNIFECSVDQAESVMKKIVSSEGSNTTVYTPPIPCKTLPRTCSIVAPFNCTTNAQRLSQLTTAGSNTMGRFVTAASGTKYFASKYYYYGYSLKEAYEYCCSIGMKVFRPTSHAMMKEVATLTKYSSTVMYTVLAATKPYNSTAEVWCDAPNAATVEKSLLYLGTVYPGYKCVNTTLIGLLSYTGSNYIKVKRYGYKANTFICQ